MEEDLLIPHKQEDIDMREEKNGELRCRGYGECLHSAGDTFIKSKELVCKYNCAPIKCISCNNTDTKWMLMIKQGRCDDCSSLSSPSSPPLSSHLSPSSPPVSKYVPSISQSYNTPYFFIFTTIIYIILLTGTINTCLFVTTFQMYTLMSYTNTSIF